MVWVGQGLKEHPVPTFPLPWEAIPPTKSGSSGPHPTWPWIVMVATTFIGRFHIPNITDEKTLKKGKVQKPK